MRAYADLVDWLDAEPQGAGFWTATCVVCGTVHHAPGDPPARPSA